MTAPMPVTVAPRKPQSWCRRAVRQWAYLHAAFTGLTALTGSRWVASRMLCGNWLEGQAQWLMRVRDRRPSFPDLCDEYVAAMEAARNSEAAEHALQATLMGWGFGPRSRETWLN